MFRIMVLVLVLGMLFMLVMWSLVIWLVPSGLGC